MWWISLSLEEKKFSLSLPFFFYVYLKRSSFSSPSPYLSLSLCLYRYTARVVLAVREIEKEAYQSVLFEKGTRGLNLFFLCRLVGRAVGLSLADFVFLLLLKP